MIAKFYITKVILKNIFKNLFGNKLTWGNKFSDWPDLNFFFFI